MKHSHKRQRIEQPRNGRAVAANAPATASPREATLGDLRSDEVLKRFASWLHEAHRDQPEVPHLAAFANTLHKGRGMSHQDASMVSCKLFEAGYITTSKGSSKLRVSTAKVSIRKSSAGRKKKKAQRGGGKLDPNGTHNVVESTTILSKAAAKMEYSLTLQGSQTPLKCIYTWDANVITQWCSSILKSGESVLGIDAEWRPKFRGGAADSPVALLQLATSSQCLLCQVSQLPAGLPAALVKLLAKPSILKVGVGAVGDCIKLMCDFGVKLGGCFDIGVLDLRRREQEGRQALLNGSTGYLRVVDPYSAEPSTEDGDPSSTRATIVQTRGLAGLAKELLGMPTWKSKSCTLSNWEKCPLTPEQVRYAAIDAWVGVRLFHKLNPTHAERAALTIKDVLKWATTPAGAAANPTLICSPKYQVSLQGLAKKLLQPSDFEAVVTRKRTPSYENDATFHTLLEKDWSELMDGAEVKQPGKGSKPAPAVKNQEEELSSQPQHSAPPKGASTTNGATTKPHRKKKPSGAARRKAKRERKEKEKTQM